MHDTLCELYKCTILHREGGVYRDPQNVLRNIWTAPYDDDVDDDYDDDDNKDDDEGSSINYVITFGGLGRPPPPYVIL